MRKFSFILSALLVLGLVSQVRAEMSPSSYSGNRYYDNQVFAIMYNNSGATVTANNVVILDTSGTAGTTLGSYFTTTTSAGSQYIVGVTDESIANGASGRVCIRGPHKAFFSASAPSAGDSISTTTTAGIAAAQTSTANKYGYIGTALADSVPGDGTILWWIWVSPNVQ